MKKIILLVIVVCVSNFSFGQRFLYGYTSSAHSNYGITHFGNISLGETVDLNGPSLNIYKDGNTEFRIANEYGYFEIAKANCNGCAAIGATPGTTVLRGHSNNVPGDSHNIILYMPNNNNDGGSNIRISDSANPNNFVVFNNGKITIGTENFDAENYRLYVRDGIKTEKVKVEIAANNGWADYVFNKDYELMSLEDLEQYINLNKHLPEVPTTKQAIENGIELKEMNILLLKKVEELTLHLIKQEKRINNLETKLLTKE